MYRDRPYYTCFLAKYIKNRPISGDFSGADTQIRTGGPHPYQGTEKLNALFLGCLIF